MLKKYLPLLAATTSSLIFAFAFFFIVKASSAVGNDPLKLLAFRLVIASAIMTLFRLLGIIKLNYKGKKWFILIISGMLTPILNFSIETIGVQFTPSSQFAVMYAASPIFITLWGALFLKEYPKAKQLIYISLSVIGVLIINFSTDLSLTPLAIAFPFAAMLTGSINAMIIKKSSSMGFSPFECLYFTTTQAAVVFASLSIGQHSIAGTLSSYFDGVLTFDFITSILYLSIGCSIIGFSLAYYNMTRLPLIVTSSFSGISTLMTISVGVFFMNENFGVRQIIGTLLIISGVMLMNMFYIRSTEQKPKVQ